MITITKLDHVVLRCRDFDAMLSFYRDLLGCPLERSEPDLGLYQLRAGDALIDLVPVNSQLGQEGGRAPDRDAHNVDHICVRVSPFDGQAILDWLDRQGIGHGGIERRNGAEGFGPSIYIDDPDGNRLELKGPAE
ncbi:VOC family protein [Spongiibacter nanhainus]|uniref:VOC family protein n=1 Tax=Spongiibacter nanhainus TaxID=2794344 RepID=A0A7T4QYK2_9GAMM|nr:VOC family protein [Spongiibacter nanhainus]QQD17160.1 VOC family protein [Spongiibacter nanhainus]